MNWRNADGGITPKAIVLLYYTKDGIALLSLLALPLYGVRPKKVMIIGWRLLRSM
jgi:hypothetical protein